MRLRDRPSLLHARRQLRRQLTPAEAALWNALKNRQLDGRRFRRQASVGPYILDFYCPAERLAIELDGAAHDHALAQAHDARRDAWLAAQGIRTLRFVNDELRHNMDGVLDEIRKHFG